MANFKMASFEIANFKPAKFKISNLKIANFKIAIILARNKKYFYSYLSLSLILILCSKNAFNVDFWKVDFEEIGNFLSDHAFLPWVEVQGVSNFRKTFFLLFT